MSNQGGGAITVGGTAYLQVFNTAFSGNTNNQYKFSPYGGATGLGGAIYVQGNASAEIAEDSFVNNTAPIGGAIAVNTTGTFTLYNSTFATNEASTAGGAVFVTNGPAVYISFTTISQNTAGVRQPGGSFPNFGGGLAFDTFTGYLETAGNIIAGNSVTFPSQG